MVFCLKNQVVSVGVTLVLCVASSSLMAANPIEDFLTGIKKITEQGEKDRAAIRARQQVVEPAPLQVAGQTGGTGQTGSLITTETAEEKQLTPTQVTISKDKKTAVAIEEAMPLIKKIVSMHRCMKANGDIRQWNFDALPGVDMTKFTNVYWPKTMLPIEKMQYHDNNKCLSAKVIDQFSMPAANALLFRAVYFADDSGEIDNFIYLFIKTDDGWKIREFERGRK